MRQTVRVHPTNLMRQAKHAAFVRRKQARATYRRAKFAIATILLGALGERLPYRYRTGRYARGRHAIPWLDTTLDPGGPQEVPRRVFVVWTGDNPLTPARSSNLKRIRATIGVEVVLVTPAEIEDWVVPGHPLHPAYEHLSLIHRSDYVRGYLMHHHGGGYVDIKRPLGSWSHSFDRFLADPGAWVMSYPTTHADWIGKLGGRIGLAILVRHRLMFGKSGFLMRSHTALTGEWLAEMERRLDAAASALAAHPGGTFGVPGYPLGWTDLLGRVLDPLTLKHLEHVRYDPEMLLDFNDYR